MEQHVYTREWHRLRPNQPGDVFTIDESDETFTDQGMATAAAVGKVAELHRSICIYRNGEPYDFRRF